MEEKNAKSTFVGRVYQVDAATLDREAETTLMNQLTEAAKYLMPNLYSRIEPEIMAIVRLVIWHYTVRRWGATFGQRVLGLSYTSLTPAAAALYAAIMAGPCWLQHRLGIILTVAAVPQHLRQKVVQRAEDLDLLVRLASLVNTLMFIRYGRFPSLMERMLGLNKCRAAPHTVTETNYTYLTREHLWRGFSELLMCVLPLIDFQRVRVALLRLLPVGRSDGSEPAPSTLTDRSRCVWCRETLVLPHALQCCHLACYYCHLAVAGGDSVMCPECGSESQMDHVLPVPVVHGSDY